MTESNMSTVGEKSPRRLVNWDLLRAISMFAVVVVHMSGYLGPIGGVPTNAIGTFAIVCDPVFFAPSGYFALRPLKTGLPKYYVRKFSSIILPLFLYSALLYVYYGWSSGLSLFGYIEYFNNVLTPWWFIPALIPYLIVAPFLYKCLESLSDDWVKLLVKFAVILSVWGVVGCFLTWSFDVTGHATLGRLIGICTSLLPATLVPNSYFIYFCLGYFIRRLIPILSDKRKKQLIVLGLSCWLLDTAFAHFGINRVDPSYAWLLATISIFMIFDRLSIPDGRVSCCIGWATEALLLDLSFAVHDDRDRDGSDLHIRIRRRHHRICRSCACLCVDWNYGLGICLGYRHCVYSRFCALEIAAGFYRVDFA